MLSAVIPSALGYPAVPLVITSYSIHYTKLYERIPEGLELGASERDEGRIEQRRQRPGGPEDEQGR